MRSSAAPGKAAAVNWATAELAQIIISATTSICAGGACLARPVQCGALTQPALLGAAFIVRRGAAWCSLVQQSNRKRAAWLGGLETRSKREHAVRKCAACIEVTLKP